MLLEHPLQGTKISHFDPEIDKTVNVRLLRSNYVPEMHVLALQGAP
jgi:hypothetical protein